VNNNCKYDITNENYCSEASKEKLCTQSSYQDVYIKLKSAQCAKCLDSNERDSQGNANQGQIFEIFPIPSNVTELIHKEQESRKKKR
jgi:hypothetical protein